MLNKRGQEEIVGFVLIIVIVAVLGLVFLRLYLQKPEGNSVESYEVQSFLQSVLQCSSSCSDYSGYLDFRDLIFECSNGGYCGERSACEILEEDLEKIMDISWNINDDGVYKAYELEIISEEHNNFNLILNLTEGNRTYNSKGSSQSFARSGEKIDIEFNVYY